MEYKDLKVDFVSGHNGTSFAEVSLIAYLPAASFLLRHLVVMLLSWNSFLVEFVIIVVPLILGMTLCANYVLQLYAVLFVASLLVAAVKWSSAADFQNSLWNFLHMPVPKPFPFLTQSRISVSLLSVLAILAVDFPVFPRRFAKTETYGVGLMDVGVGLFVTANGLISPEARSALSQDLQRHWYIQRNLKGTLPLFFLGFVRLVSTAGVGYHLHESEYGVHWNFFFTLAVIRVVASLLEPLITLIPYQQSYALVSLIIIGMYQFSLSYLGLSNYLIHGAEGGGSRGGLLDANREGLVSCLGYVALYLSSVQLGRFIFKSRVTVQQWVRTALQLYCLTGMLWVLTVMSHLYIQPVSRRFANLAYYFWMLAMITSGTLAYMTVDAIVLLLSYHLNVPLPLGLYRHHPNTPQQQPLQAPPPPPNPPASSSISQHGCLITAISKNHLAFFLLANVFTGVVNLWTDTIHTSDIVAIYILLVYTFVLCQIFHIAQKLGLSTKFW